MYRSWKKIESLKADSLDDFFEIFDQRIEILLKFSIKGFHFMIQIDVLIGKLCIN